MKTMAEAVSPVEQFSCDSLAITILMKMLRGGCGRGNGLWYSGSKSGRSTECCGFEKCIGQGDV